MLRPVPFPKGCALEIRWRTCLAAMADRPAPVARAPRPATSCRPRRGRVSPRLLALLAVIVLVGGIWLLLRRPQITPAEPIGSS